MQRIQGAPREAERDKLMEHCDAKSFSKRNFIHGGNHYLEGTLYFVVTVIIYYSNNIVWNVWNLHDCVRSMIN